MIVFDQETDRLMGPTALPLDQQPKIIETAVLVLDDKTLKEKAHFTTFVNPGRDIPAEITKITGITDKMVKSAPTFPRVYPDLVRVFLGQRTLVAHNLPFDRGVLAGELQRIDRLLEFPWPPDHICTCEGTEHLEGKYLKQSRLYEIATGEAANQTHRALDDVRQLADIVRWCRKEGIL